MKKIFAFLLFLSFVGTHNSYGQVQAGLVLGFDIPVGDFSNLFKPGFCFGATGKYALSEKMSVGGNLHYNSFSGNKYNDPYYFSNWKNKASITAFTGLFQYYFSDEKLKPYAGGDLGFYFWNTRYYYYWVNPAGHPTYNYGTGHGTALGIAPSGGITYDLTDKLVFDGNLKFNLMLTESSLNYLGINLGLFYKFGGE